MPNDHDFITKSLADGSLSEVRFESTPAQQMVLVTVKKGYHFKSLWIKRLHILEFGHAILANTVQELAQELDKEMRSDDASPAP